MPVALTYSRPALAGFQRRLKSARFTPAPSSFKQEKAILLAPVTADILPFEQIPPAIPAKEQTPAIFTDETLALNEALVLQTGRLLHLGACGNTVGTRALQNGQARHVTFAGACGDELSRTYKAVQKMVEKGHVSEITTDYHWGTYEDLSSEEAAEFDRITFVPAQLPTAMLAEAWHKKLITRRQRLHETGGLDGLDKVRAFADWFKHLGPTAPQALLLIYSLPGHNAVRQVFEEAGLNAEAISESRLPVQDVVANALPAYDTYELLERGLQKQDGRWTQLATVYRVTPDKLHLPNIS